MKKEKVLILIVALISPLFLLSGYIKTFINNMTTDYVKYVILGGEDITVYINDNVVNNENTVSNNTVSASSGILTYIDCENETFGAIAHNITDKEGYVNGEIYSSEILGINKSTTTIGNKIAAANTKDLYGSVNKTSNTGIYGEYTGSYYGKEAMLVGMPSEVKLGSAYLLTSLNGETKYFEIKITNINMFRIDKNMTIKIADEELLSETGGIVKGMSGSPIIQNGKIIGALSHSYSNDFTKGSAIFITNMIK